MRGATLESPLLLVVVCSIAALSCEGTATNSLNVPGDCSSSAGEDCTVAPDTSDMGRDTVYAFTSELSADREISPGSPIVCDNNPINEGGLYFNTSGQFACIDDAVYVFVWSARRVGGVHCLSTLRLGGEAVLTGPQTSYYSNEFYSGNSQMLAVLQCRTNPFSAVTVVSALGNSPSPVYGSQFTSFSGFRLRDSGSAVGFTAALSNDKFVYPGGRLIFDDVTSNFGGFYKGLHGYFRCPDDGVYSFTVSTQFPEPLTGPVQWSVSRLIFDGATILQGPVTYGATNSHQSGSASATAVVLCQYGKDVYVEAQESFEFESSKYGAGLTSFSGVGLCHGNCSDYVAFTSVLSRNTTTNDVTVVFDDVLSNVGDAYDPSTGVFTCPDDLLYMFSSSATSNMGSCYLDLYVGSNVVKSSYMTYQPGSADMFGTSGTASMSSIVRCTAGSEVSLKASNLSSSRNLLADYTSFSCYRLPGQ